MWRAYPTKLSDELHNQQHTAQQPKSYPAICQVNCTISSTQIPQSSTLFQSQRWLQGKQYLCSCHKSIGDFRGAGTLCCLWRSILPCYRPSSDGYNISDLPFQWWQQYLDSCSSSDGDDIDSKMIRTYGDCSETLYLTHPSCDTSTVSYIRTLWVY